MARSREENLQADGRVGIRGQQTLEDSLDRREGGIKSYGSVT